MKHLKGEGDERAPVGALAHWSPREARVRRTIGKNAVAVAGRAADREVVAALFRRDEATFLALVECHHRSMIHLARRYVCSDAVAEEVAQDAWLALLRKLEQWKGRGSLRSWLYGIVARQARSRAVRESRTVPFSSVMPPRDGPAPRLHAGPIPEDCTAWADAPGSPEAWLEDHVECRELVKMVKVAIETLPPMQRAVITLWDVSGCDGPAACAGLRISEGNRRVLLHRARSRVRKAVGDRLGVRRTLRPSGSFQELVS
jgi:RNA polymerase sigma-70 factor (ECF subfamily)